MCSETSKSLNGIEYVIAEDGGKNQLVELSRHFSDSFDKVMQRDEIGEYFNDRFSTMQSKR